jgi:hypothetical protein
MIQSGGIPCRIELKSRKPAFQALSADNKERSNVWYRGGHLAMVSLFSDSWALAAKLCPLAERRCARMSNTWLRRARSALSTSSLDHCGHEWQASYQSSTVTPVLHCSKDRADRELVNPIADVQSMSNRGSESFTMPSEISNSIPRGHDPSAYAYSDFSS